ncbi:unnamed protein product [Phyllotreta striolata]|uniref:C2H2-type domain-containing protein n=1 Tax=Phyllotreta striolata TaxID=444603 RepID=A0A9N9TLB5_PHYSR|nr:unnamed protein product [Phyllotreta striolata]
MARKRGRCRKPIKSGEKIDKNINNNYINTPKEKAKKNNAKKTEVITKSTTNSCSYCGSLFSKRTTLQKHLNKCCKNTTNSLAFNIKTGHSQSNVHYSYSCQHCSKSFLRNSTYRTHVSICSTKNTTNEVIANTTSNTSCSNNPDETNRFSSSSSKSPKSDHKEQNETTTTCTNTSNTINVSQNIIIPVNKLLDKPDSDAQSTVLIDTDDSDVQIIQQKIPKYDLSIYDYDEDIDTAQVPSPTKNKCKICEYTADSPIELIKHKRTKHAQTEPVLVFPPEEVRKYFDWPDRSTCPLCGKQLKTRNYKSLFLRHLSVHTVGLAYECRICGKKFRRVDQLRGHENRHVVSYEEVRALKDAVYEDDVALRQHINM